ncbi:class I SAM-dependent methyltransferase [Bacteriovorax sp. Seq25_V]|uniref:class I SAM-dependent methyltransferase n=1 Tax=Bacteriovorax sp. Seq25_V TaxID=1201288 RepID=UPI00038A290D|nr:class I SAM-dependent methyltransferase [Bacteriovorax sp. Seq25_V]EQC45315.1 methyltransferase domain protein [Bacteriovorax sp. Seq25_V]
MKNLNAGAHASPNIQTDSDIYELENRACDPDHKIESFLETKFGWETGNVLDIGCGTGFHLPFFAKKANHVFGVEPHDDSRIKGMKRLVDENLKNVSILKGTAEAISLEDDLIDFAYARFAYFWGAGCEKGIEEVFRVLKQGGSFAMIDNNLERGTFGNWVKRSFNFSNSKQSETDEFWKNQGFELKVIDSAWEFTNREDLESVLKIEFPAKIYDEIIKEHKGLVIDYTFNLYFKSKV